MPALKEALCGDEGVAVNDYSLGQVNTMACGPYMLCQSQSSRIIVLECPLMFAEVVIECFARLCTVHIGVFEQGVWYTTPVRSFMGTGSLGWTSWCLRVVCGQKPL